MVILMNFSLNSTLPILSLTRRLTSSNELHSDTTYNTLQIVHRNVYTYHCIQCNIRCRPSYISNVIFTFASRISM